MMADPTTERRRAHERAEIREALTLSEARASIDRLLGEELIAAAREAVAAWRAFGRLPATADDYPRVQRAIKRLEELVGKP